jgi:signal transduction histidine kinase
LDAFQYIVTSKLTDKENRILDLLKKSINDIASKLMEKYIEVKEMENKSKSRRYFNFSIPRTEKKKKRKKIDLNVSIKEVIERKEYEYSNKNVEIKYEGKVKLVFIKGAPIGFERMMSNIINNGVDAVEGKKKAEIEIICEEKGKDVEIKIKDNGTGMPKEMIEKLVAGEEIGTTKKGGHE